MHLLIDTLALCLLLASAETLHGIARTLWVAPRLGQQRARRWSVISGSLLAFGLCAWRVPGFGLQGPLAHALLGAVLAAFMASFDLALTHWLLRRPWRQALQDLNLRQGQLLPLGLMALAASPTLVWWLQRSS
ncbi:hypothetical protein KAK06_05510 [Ideonella sp. 4Y11]|uniref:Uncharacterized protein n=1 Tax=Ideonella aquatica TaxID=2824119 RepID=A0A941BKB9_9BURK|nr:hypothetical protein [Ideonella aquatica]MBQ0958409.1 hypothetical protein [Ideonella aquatica]